MSSWRRSSPWQNLIYFGRLEGLRAAEIKPRVQRLLRELGLWDRRNQQVGGFSRGMQQKVAVAAASAPTKVRRCGSTARWSS